MNRSILVALIVCALLSGTSHVALSQSVAYPIKPVRIIVPFAAGAGTDLFARVIGLKMQERLGQPFVVENKTGAGGMIGAEFVAKSAPDGYTLLLVESGITTIPYLHKAAPFNPIEDFAPIGISAAPPAVLVVANSVPVKSINELIAYAKANPGKLSYASAGVGTLQHLFTELFMSMTGTQMVHVPYKGGSALLNSVIADEVQFLVSTPTAIPMIKSGKVRALAVGGHQRYPGLSDVPTVDESVRGYEAGFWYGLAARAGTPEAIVNKLSSEQRAILNLPEVHKRLSAYNIVAGTAEEMRKTMAANFELWGKVVKFARIEPE